jgi:hypothetical protein
VLATLATEPELGHQFAAVALALSPPTEEAPLADAELPTAVLFVAEALAENPSCWCSTRCAPKASAVCRLPGNYADRDRACSVG